MASYTASDVTSADFVPLFTTSSDPVSVKFNKVNYVDSDIKSVNFNKVNVIASDVSSFNYNVSEKPKGKNDYIFNISSNVKLYRDRDSELDASKNILKNSDTDFVYYSDTLYGKFSFENSLDDSVTSDSFDVTDDQYYVLTFVRNATGSLTDKTPSFTIEYNDGSFEELGELSLTDDKAVVRFKTPHEVTTAILRINDTSAKTGVYTFTQFGIFTAVDYEQMLVDSPNINCVISYDERLASASKSEVKDALKDIADIIKTSALSYISEYDSLYTEKCIEVRIMNVEGIYLYSTNSKNNYFAVAYAIYEDSTKSTVLSAFEENVIYLDDYFSDIEPLGKLKLTLDTKLKNTNMMKLFLNNGYEGTVSSTLATSTGGGETYVVLFTLTDNAIVNTLQRTAIVARHKIKNTPASNDGVSSTPTAVSVLTISGVISNPVAISTNTGTPEVWVGSVSSINVASETVLEYTEDTTPYWDTSKNTFMTNVYEYFKLNPKAHQDEYTKGSITDTFTPYKEFYYSKLNATYIDDIYHNEEWFRLYGVDHETDVFNVYSIKRKTTNSIIMLNRIPIEYTTHRLLTYDDVEYIVVNKSTDVMEFGELHTPVHGYSSNGTSLFIHKDGTVNNDKTDGMFVCEYNQLIKLGKGIHLIPEGHVSIGENYLVLDKDNKVIRYPERIVFYNKMIIIDDDITVYVPINRATSMFEPFIEEVYRSGTYTSSYWKDFFSKLDVIMQRDAFVTDYAMHYPKAESLDSLKSTNVKSSDINEHLKHVTSTKNRFKYTESDAYFLNTPENVFNINVTYPKLLLPYQKRKNTVVFMNGKLFKVNPDRFNDDFMMFDLRDVYNITDEDLNFRLDYATTWYENNKQENEFEVVYYDDADTIIDTSCTVYNDSYIPLPLKLLGMNYEVYIDGIFASSYIHKSSVDVEYINTRVGAILTTLESEHPNVPVLYLRKYSNNDTYSVYSKVVVICTSRNNSTLMLNCVNGALKTINPVSNTTEFFYENGEKIMPSEYTVTSPHSVMFYKLPDKVIMKTEVRSNTYHTAYSDYVYEYLKSNNEYSEYVNTNMVKKNISDILYTMTSREFDTYCTLVCGSLYFMKQGALDSTFSGSLIDYVEMKNAFNKSNFSVSDPVVTATKITPSRYGMTSIYIEYCDVIRKISPFVYFERTINDTIDTKDIHFIGKISYLNTLYFAEHVSAYSQNHANGTVYDDPRSSFETDIMLTEEEVNAYNSTFENILTTLKMNKSSIAYYSNIFSLNDTSTRIGISYGILKPECFVKTGNKRIVTPTYRTSTRLASTGSVYNYNLRGNLYVD